LEVSGNRIGKGLGSSKKISCMVRRKGADNPKYETKDHSLGKGDVMTREPEEGGLGNLQRP